MERQQNTAPGPASHGTTLVLGVAIYARWDLPAIGPLARCLIARYVTSHWFSIS